MCIFFGWVFTTVEVARQERYEDLVEHTAEMRAEADRLFAFLRSPEQVAPDINALSKKNNAFLATADLVDREDKQAHRTLWGAFIMIIVGLAIAAIGFWLWYTRLQRHLDRLLEAEVRTKLTVTDGNPSRGSASSTE